jgi:hypothetical protein
MSARMTSPPRTPADILDELQQRYAMAEVRKILSPLLGEDDAAPAGGL